MDCRHRTTSPLTSNKVVQIKDRLCVKGGKGKKCGIAYPDERP